MLVWRESLSCDNLRGFFLFFFFLFLVLFCFFFLKQNVECLTRALVSVETARSCSISEGKGGGGVFVYNDDKDRVTRTDHSAQPQTLRLHHECAKERSCDFSTRPPSILINCPSFIVFCLHAPPLFISFLCENFENIFPQIWLILHFFFPAARAPQNFHHENTTSAFKWTLGLIWYQEWISAVCSDDCLIDHSIDRLQSTPYQLTKQKDSIIHSLLAQMHSERQCYQTQQDLSCVLHLSREIKHHAVLSLRSPNCSMCL